MNRARKGFDIANKTINDNNTTLANRVFAIASGGLAVSLSILTYLHSLSYGVSIVNIIWILFLYLVCIILDTYAIIYARNKARKTAIFFREKVSCGEDMTEEEVIAVLNADNCAIKIMNAIATTILFIAIIYTISYCLLIISK